MTTHEDIAKELRDMRERLGYDVYDRIPANLFVVSNKVIAIMAELEEMAERLEGMASEPLPAQASPAEVRERLAKYRGGARK